MFTWLEKILSEAEKKGEIVHIMNHIPMLSTHHTIQCAWRIKILMLIIQWSKWSWSFGHFRFRERGYLLTIYK